MLEDESGRIKLIGEPLKGLRLVTGVIIAALGVETSAGEFQVVDTCFAGMAPQGVPPLLSSHLDMEVDQGEDTAHTNPARG
jgi:DNA polymerase delta subunit 2